MINIEYSEKPAAGACCSVTRCRTRSSISSRTRRRTPPVFLRLCPAPRPDPQETMRRYIERRESRCILFPRTAISVKPVSLSRHHQCVGQKSFRKNLLVSFDFQKGIGKYLQQVPTLVGKHVRIAEDGKVENTQPGL